MELREAAERELELRKQYEEAEDKKFVRCLHSQHLDEVEREGKQFVRLYCWYVEALEKGNETLDIADAIWESEVEDLVSAMKKCGLHKFTFSSTWSNSVGIAWEFIENGCELAGITQINGSEAFGGDHEKKAAYVFALD